MPTVFSTSMHKKAYYLHIKLLSLKNHEKYLLFPVKLMNVVADSVYHEEILKA